MRRHRGSTGSGVGESADAPGAARDDDRRMVGATMRHRALADPTRERLLELLRGSEQPLSVGALAAALGLHENTIRAHLRLLERAELVVPGQGPTGGPGRPATLYAAVPPDAEEEHALLAASLASALEPLADGAEIAASAGRSWGAVLVERPPGGGLDAAASIERVATLLRGRGFAPETGEAELVMHRCPFRELAEEYPRVVCAFHAGLIEGALDELGGSAELDRLEPWVTPSTCVARF